MTLSMHPSLWPKGVYRISRKVQAGVQLRV